MSPFEGVPSRADYKSSEREFHQAGGELQYDVDAEAQVQIDALTKKIDPLREKLRANPTPEEKERIFAELEPLMDEKVDLENAIKTKKGKSIN